MQLSKHVTPASVLFLCLISWGIFASVFWSTLLWPDYNHNIQNDVDTPLYTSFALNLVDCPLSISLGIMVNALRDCQTLMVGEPFSYYNDHPPGMVWWLSPFLWSSDQPILVARLIVCLFGAGTVLLCSWVAYFRIGAIAAIGVLLSSLFIPLFWRHGVVVHLNQATLFFSTLMVASFLRHETTNQRGWLVISWIAFALGGVTDWPAFFVAGPIGTYLLLQKRFGLFCIYLVIGIAMLLSMFVYLSNVPAAGPSYLERLVELIDKSAVGSKASANLHHVPTGKAVWISTRTTFRVMSAVGFVLLLLPLAGMMIKSIRHKYLEPTGLILCCFYVQGLLNQFLFLQWAATHNYWNYYYIPVILISGGILLDFLWNRLPVVRSRPLASATAIMIVVMTATVAVHIKWWLDFTKHPLFLSEYLKEKGLDGMLSESAVLLSHDTAPFFGQGFKLRMIFPKPLQPLSSAQSFDCTGVYSIYKLSTLTDDTRNQLPRGIELDQFDWYVVPSNHGNSQCQAS